MYKCVLVLKITKNLYIVVVMLLCAKIKNDFSKRHLDSKCFMWRNHQRQGNKYSNVIYKKEENISDQL